MNKKLADLARQEVAKDGGDAEKERELEDNIRVVAETSGQLSDAVKDALQNKGNSSLPLSLLFSISPFLPFSLSLSLSFLRWNSSKIYSMIWIAIMIRS